MGYYDEDPPPEFKLGDLDEAWLENMHVRLCKQWERGLEALERARDAPPDPFGPVRQSLELLERMLKVQGLMRKAYPKRSRLARRNRRRKSPWPG